MLSEPFDVFDAGRWPSLPITRARSIACGSLELDLGMRAGMKQMGA